MTDFIAETQDVMENSENVNGTSKIEEESWGILLPLVNNYPIIKLTKDKVQVGRLAEVVLDVDVPYFISISKVHFEIQKEGDVVFLYDKSANGTFLDDKKIGKGNKAILLTDMEISLCVASNRAYMFRNFSSLEPPPPKEVADKYTISKKLGCGAYGEVKLAFKNHTYEAFAVKIIGKRKLSKFKSSQTIESEVAIMKKLSHPCIVKLEEAIETDESVYIFLELVRGGEVFQRVEKKEFKENEAKALFYQMVLAIKYLHENSIVHRDLKPENILMSSTDQNVTLIKITDFGMSKFLDGKTMLKTMCGTPNYLAPEVIKHMGLEAYSPACDVWSLGVILFICLVGYPPFSEDREDYSLREQILGGKVDYPKCFWKTVSEEAKQLVQLMLKVDESERIGLTGILEHPWIAKDKEMQQQVNKLMYPQSDIDSELSGEPVVKKKKML